MTTFEAPAVYGNTAGTTSSIGSQFRTDFYKRRALVEASKEMYFGQLANVQAMPKNMGKTIKQYHYMPLLDDRNMNSQGIDGSGVSLEADFVAAETVSKAVITCVAPAAEGGMTYYFEGFSTGSSFSNANGLADDDAEFKVFAWAIQKGYVVSSTADYAAAKTLLEAAGWTVTNQTTGVEHTNYGNLYGSSKDVGNINAKIPALTEVGGRVNRVGMKRLDLSGTIEKFGFFTEYTQESLDFDTDPELVQHLTTEAVKGANELTEDQLQIDLLTNAGVVRFAGDATSTATLGGSTAVGNNEDVVVYDDLVKLAIELDNNRCPKNTKVITGSRMTDTKVVNAARYAYIGSELIPAFMRMTDYHSAKAFIPVAQYGAATTIARGEFGAVHDFRLIVVPEMMHWEHAGATVSDDADEVCIWSTTPAGAQAVNVYPILVVGDGAFTTIGFQTSGKTVKFTTYHKRPGKEIADRHNPYGEVGFFSIKWYYGFMLLRPERLAILKTVATL